MIRERGWIAMVIMGILMYGGSGCTVQQQQQVLGAIGSVIPGSSTSVITPGSRTASESQAAPTPTPRVDPDRVEAQLVLRTLQRAMSENPVPFQECLDNAQCKPALAAYLIRLQKQAMSTLELPPVYDRYDLKRGRE